MTSPSATWEMTKPKGYWSPGEVWTSLLCDHSYLTPSLALDCLRDTSIWVFGDSNSLRLYWPLQDWTQCSATGNGAWPQKEVCKNKVNNITLTFTPHEYPLHLGASWVSMLRYDGVAQHIDAMPSNEKIIVIIHYYLHVLTSHLSFAELRLRSVTEACKRLLDRNPDATIAFRGPHVASLEYEINHTISGDSLGRFYFKIILKVFKDLMNRIIFLDGWDMTIALENSEFHPTENVPKFLINVLLSFRCNTTGYHRRN
ncbi:NXPE family member 4-like [Physella acuta]|uniref:NXPE family member 4-like n=1 Tax=Physella acuta TaxID=109671 RepID=UPI0027DCFECE|nr:NXPE family member 4-like [Physella acuta]